jgi:diadenosine tetraphosphate (Ap4A) HIT family hydrolase
MQFAAFPLELKRTPNFYFLAVVSAMFYTKRSMLRYLFNFARSPFGHIIVRWIFSNMSFVIPVKRLRETDYWIVFRHPQPVYPFHVLLVSKWAFPSLMEIPGEGAPAILKDLIQIVQSLVLEYHLEDGYRLNTNGGIYQDIPILHFHLIAGESGTIDDKFPL